MDESEFNNAVALICVRFLKNAAHSFNVPLIEINEVLHECRKRGVDVSGVE